jgi:mRNA-degrading endonuclease RelE of RelBE toxin-antitoxin system
VGAVKGYRLFFSETAGRQVAKLHPEIKSVVRSRLDKLRNEPFAGKRLERELSGYRSLRARRFRIIYKVDRQEQVLQIHYVGHRKDIYELLAEQKSEP